MSLLDVARWLHILSGAAALVALPVPLVARKGGPAHRRFGRVFVHAMNAVAGTGAVVAAARLADPATRDGGLFLLHLGLLVATTNAHATAALRHKDRTGPVRSFDTTALPGLLALASVLTLGRGLAGHGVLPLAFGGLGLWTAATVLAFHARAPSPGEWLREHISGTIATAIGAVTAFLVVNVGRFDLPVPALVAWLAPTVLGTAAIVAWRRAVRGASGPASAG